MPGTQLNEIDRLVNSNQLVLIKLDLLPSIRLSQQSRNNPFSHRQVFPLDTLRTHPVCARRKLDCLSSPMAFRWQIAFVFLAAGMLFSRHAAVADEPEIYRSYELKHQTASEAESVLAEMLESLSEPVHLVVDAKKNRLLLSGPAKAHQIASSVLATIDRPAPLATPAVIEPVLKSYSCPQAKIKNLVSSLRERYTEHKNVRIAADSAGERLIVLASPEIHREISATIKSTNPQGDPFSQEDDSETEAAPPIVRQQSARVSSSSTEKTVTRAAHQHEKSKTRPQVLPAEILPAVTDDPAETLDGGQFLGLLHIKADSMIAALHPLLSDRFEAIGSTKTHYLVTVSDESSAEITLDRRRNGVTIAGDPTFVPQLTRMIRCLDEPKTSSVDRTAVLPLHGLDMDKVEAVKNAFLQRERSTTSTRDSAKPQRTSGKSTAVKNAAHVGDRASLSTIRLVGNQDSSAGTADGGTEASPRENPEGDELQQQLRRLGSELEIEVLPDLDAIILRGNKPDVQEMTRILKELERLSLETEPLIEIYPLKHVRGESLVALIEKVTTDLTGSLQGRVTVTPLVKPNSLLIIGWGESVKSIRQLIEKLDQPIPEDAEFQVFRLKHADAQPTRTTVQEFFTARTTAGTGTGAAAGTGLAPRVQVTADLRTNSLIVQAPPRDIKEAAELIEELDVPGGAVVQQARIFKLKNTLAADLVTVLQSAIDATRGKEGTGNVPQKSSLLEFLSIDKEGRQVQRSAILSDVKVTADPRTNSLLVSAAAESMELIASLIQRLDEATPEGAQIKVFRVINGDAISLVQMLRSLLPPSSGPAGSPQLASSRDESSLVATRFSVDLRTNSIIATGSPGDLRIIEALLLRLDQKDVEQRKNTVYRLKNAPADAVARSVNDFLRSERSVQQAAPGAISPFQQIESEVVVVPEPVGNSLIISATPRFFDEIEALVEKLDAQPPQVMIQVLIAEVSLNNTNEFGVELGLQDSLLFDRSLMGNLVTTTSTVQSSSPSGILTATSQKIVGATNTPGFAFNGAPLGNSGSADSLATASNVAGQAVSNFGVGSINNQLGYGGLVLSASSENVSMLIRALQQSNRLEVLSRPQIRTLDNQPAFIQIGQRVPRIVSASVTQVGSVNGVTLENVGLILGVTPRISPEGLVVMEVDAEKSEVDVVNQGIPVSVSANGAVIRSPIFNITTASTTVSAQSGETIIIGGLITKSSNDTVRRVPLLSDIPVLGNLFRYDSSISRRSELLIILTPYVIRSPEESARIKREEVAKMHWCAGDVLDVYGPGIIADEAGPFIDAQVPVIYPDANPRGTLQPVELPPEPGITTTIQVDQPTVNLKTSKPKKPGFFPVVSQKKRK